MKIGTRVRIIPKFAHGSHAHAGEIGAIIGDEEVNLAEPEYNGIERPSEFWVKFDNPRSHIKICPFHPSEFEVIE